MLLYDQTSGRRKTKLELAGLLAAAFGVAVVLTVGASGTHIESSFTDQQRLLLIAGLSVAGVVAALLLARALWRARREARVGRSETRLLRRNLATAEAMIRAEPQVLVFWEHSRPPQVVTHTLTSVPGLPSNQHEFLRFGFWLEARAAQVLKSNLDTLFAEGKSFNVIVKTLAGAHVEADGRAAGGRAVLRFRDVVGYKQDLAVIFDHHALLARDIRANREILNALDTPAWLRGPDQRLVWVNNAYVRAVEAKDDEEVLSNQIELLESRQRQDVQAALRKNKPYIDRIQLVIGGERKSHDVKILPLGDAIAGLAIDIDSLETAQSELDRYVETYDRTLDRVATAVAVFGPDKRLTFFNQAYANLWKLKEDWLESKPTDSAILDRLRELGLLPEVVHYREWRDKILRVYEAGNELDDWWHLADGRMLHVMAEQRPDGGVTYLYADETERLALESRYNALIRVQGETLDSLKEAVAVFGTDGRLALANAAFISIWKLSRKNVEQSPHIDEFVRDASVLCADGNALQDIRQAVTAFSDQREPIDGQMVRSDNSVIDYASTPLPDGGTLLTFIDVTDSKRYERALVERNEALVAADKLKNRFISNVSYELRTPLTNIIGFSEFLESPHIGNLNGKQREYLSDITNSSKTLLSIIDGLLDLATIDAGELQLNLGEVDANQAIDNAIDHVRQAAARAQLTLDIAVGDDVGKFYGDEARVTQVLSHLLSNAIGFSEPNGVVEVSCWLEADEIVFKVEDHGVGIAEDQQERVFDRFESNSHGSKHRGPGLGLAVVKSLVDLHGGSMTLDSELGRGTEITVRFPERATQSADTEIAFDDDLDVADSQGR
ncbi:MAG: PAS-domain containing protein [Alphaproteobacteria bacterium]|nr:PAS-domain containing protein [Alphaproteobacteria bacterium]